MKKTSWRALSIVVLTTSSLLYAYEKECQPNDPAVRLAAPFGGRKATYSFVCKSNPHDRTPTQTCYVRLTDDEKAAIREVIGSAESEASIDTLEYLPGSITARVINDLRLEQDVEPADYISVERLLNMVEERGMIEQE